MASTMNSEKDGGARSFDPRVLASITSGTLLIEPFSLVHEAVEHIVGHPVWTHELPALQKTCTAAILALYPDMPQDTPEDWQSCAAEVSGRYGATISMPKGSGERTATPVETLNSALSFKGGANG